MRLFGRKKREGEEAKEEVSHEEVEDTGYDSAAPEPELTDVEAEVMAKKHELQELSGKLNEVKKEYDAAVASLMVTKKEINEEKNHIASLERQHRVVKARVEAEEKQHMQKKAKLQDMEGAGSQLARIREEITAARESLNEVDAKRVRAEDHYRKILAKIDAVKQRQGGVVAGQQADPKNVIEAASAVVASMKAKVSIAQKELDMVRDLLRKEREAHAKTRQELQDRLKKQ